MVKPARTAGRRTRSTILVALAVGSASLIGVLVNQSPASSTAATAIPVLPSERRALGGPDGVAPGGPMVLPTERRQRLDETDGILPDGTTIWDDDFPGISKLDPALVRVLRQAAADAAGEGIQLFVDSGWRSRKYQEQLFREAVSSYGSTEEAARWVATPGTSAHESGNAVDIGPVDATDWLFEHGADYGLCQIYGNEPWHYELRPSATEGGCPPMYANSARDA